MTVFSLVIALVAILIGLWFFGSSLKAANHLAVLGCESAAADISSSQADKHAERYKSFVRSYPNGIAVLDRVYFSPNDWERALWCVEHHKPLPNITKGSKQEFMFWANIVANEEAATMEAGKTSSKSKKSTAKTTVKPKAEESQDVILAKMKRQDGDRKLNTEVTSL